MASPPGPDWRAQLAQILGAAGGLRGNRGFTERWAQLEAQQRQQQAQQAEQARQQEQLRLQQEGAQRATDQQRVQSLNALRQLLDVNQVEDQDEYTQREAFASQLAPSLGVDPGFITSLRPNPTRWEVKEAKTMLAEIQKQHKAEQLDMLRKDDATGSAPVFTLPKSGKQLTYAQLEQIAQAPVPRDRTTGRTVVLPAPATDKRGFATKDVTINGRRMLAGFDPDKNQYFAPGDVNTPLTGDIQEYQKPAPETATGLPPRIQQAVNAQSRGWDSLPIVKNV